MSTDTFFELGEPKREVLPTRNPLPKPKKGTYDENAHLHGSGARQDRGRHYCAMLGEGEGQILDVLATFQGHGL